MNIMTNKITKIFAAGILSCSLAAMFTSCDDILETENSRDLSNYELSQKTDSMFMANGILQTMQQLADVYVLQGEMRGDLVDTTYYTNEQLRQLADFSLTATNRYDSAYVYYAVVNNCNYYLAHRDTTLMTGSQSVTLDEYGAVKAIRAWAYLMLARNYGRVPIFFQPLIRISDINSINTESNRKDFKEILQLLIADLESLPDAARVRPSYGTIACGTTNAGQTKTALSKLCYIPVDVILGELNLELGNYPEAVKYYTKYLIDNRITTGNRRAPVSTQWLSEPFIAPIDYSGGVSGNNWSAFYETLTATDDIITYIPMSVNRLSGTVSQLPQLFGYDFLATSTQTYTDEVQVVPSAVYQALADSTDYYYSANTTNTVIKSLKIGDMRRAATLHRSQDNSQIAVDKYRTANVVLYRNTTVFLHLAEALNRMGHPDLAFAILKDGIDEELLDADYLTDASKELLQTSTSFLSATNRTYYTASPKSSYGIHRHGCGFTNGVNSPYQLDSIVGLKLQETMPQTTAYTKNDTIDAVEDILCDEYAMEFAFEGTRYYDLCRLARHKNDVQAGRGSQWLADKLSSKHPVVSLEADERNWYLPYPSE